MTKAGMFAGRPDGFRWLFTELKHFPELIDHLEMAPTV